MCCPPLLYSMTSLHIMVQSHFQLRLTELYFQLFVRGKVTGTSAQWNKYEASLTCLIQSPAPSRSSEQAWKSKFSTCRLQARSQRGMLNHLLDSWMFIFDFLFFGSLFFEASLHPEVKCALIMVRWIYVCSNYQPLSIRKCREHRKAQVKHERCEQISFQTLERLF